MSLSIEAQLGRIADSVKSKDGSALAEQALGEIGALCLRAVTALKGLGKGGAKDLVAALEAKDETARARAARAIGGMGDKAGAKGLSPLFKDKSALVRASAAEALGRLGDTTSAGNIESLLGDDAPAVRRAAARALGDLGAAKSGKAVAELLEDDHATVRRAAVRALSAMGASKHLEGLLARVTDRDEGVRLAAIEAITGQTGGDILEALSKTLTADSLPVRLAAARAVALVEAEGVGARLSTLLSDRSAHVRRIAIDAIARRKMTGAIEGLLRVLQEGPESELRIAAARALGELGEKVAVERLTLTLLVDDHALQAAAEAALVSILGKSANADALRADGNIQLERWDEASGYGKAAVDPLLRALDTTDANPRNLSARCGAARALGALGDKRAVKALVRALGEPAPRVRAAAARALGEIGDASGIDALLVATSDGNPKVRVAAVQALGSIGTEGVVEAIARAVTDSDDSVRMAALKAVAGLSPAAIHIARRGLSATTAEERVLAVQALGTLGTPDALDYLHDGLDDNHPRVRDAARRALAAAGWHPIGMRPRRLEPGYARWFRPSEWIDPGEKKRPTQVDVLIKALADDDPIRRRAAIEVLGEIGGTKAGKPLAALLKDPDPDIQATAGAALVALGTEPEAAPGWAPYRVAQHDWAAVAGDGASAIPALLSELRHPEPEVRRGVLTAAAEIAEPSSIAVLLAGWCDRDESIGEQAVALLLEVPEPLAAKGVSALDEDDAAKAVLLLTSELGAGHPPPVRKLAARLLASCSAEAASAALVAAANSDDAELHPIALSALEKHKSPEALAAIESLLQRSPEETIRAWAAKALALAAGEGAVRGVSSLLLSKNDVLIATAEELLKGLLGKKYSREALVATRLVDLDRWQDAAALGKHAVKPLTAVVDDPEQHIRANARRPHAVLALAAAGGKGSLTYLKGLITHEDERVRGAAARAMEAVGEADAGEAVRALLSDHFEQVRAAAALAAGALDGPGAVEALTALLDDPDEEVRRAAYQGMVRLGSVSVPTLATRIGIGLSNEAKLWATEALGAIGHISGVDTLITSLNDMNGSVRNAARRGLAACNWQPVGLKQHRTDAGYRRWTTRTEWLSEEPGAGGPPGDRGAGQGGAADEDGADTLAQVALLTTALGSDPDPIRRRAAAEALGDVGDPAAVEALTEALTSDADVDVRIVAAQSLVTLGQLAERTPEWAPFWAGAGQWDACVALGEPAVPALGAMLAEPAPRVRLGAVLALKEIGGEVALAAVAGMADDPDDRVRTAAGDEERAAAE